MCATDIRHERARTGASWILVLVLAAASWGCGDAPLEPKERAVIGFPTAVSLEWKGAKSTPIALPIPADRAPDYEDGTRAAWRLDRLYGARFWKPGATMEVHSATGPVQRQEAVGPADDGLVAVLTTNRSGEAVIAWIDPADPFPEFHGRGGNRKRQGDPRPRVWAVVRVRLIETTTPGAAAAEKDIRSAMLELKLTVDGEEKTLTDEDLAELEILDVVGDEGKDTRDALSLRDLVRRVVGAGARVTTIRSDGHREAKISPEAWADATRTPVLRLNRRGKFKFHWMDESRAPIAGEDLRNVHMLVVESGN